VVWQAIFVTVLQLTVTTVSAAMLTIGVESKPKPRPWIVIEPSALAAWFAGVQRETTGESNEIGDCDEPASPATMLKKLRVPPTLHTWSALRKQASDESAVHVEV
jgi:hypothetical protein